MKYQNAILEIGSDTVGSLRALDLIAEAQSAALGQVECQAWIGTARDTSTGAVESVDALYIPETGRIGIVTNGNAQWDDAESIDAGLGAWLDQERNGSTRD